jgi:signal peptidase II
MPRLGRAIVFLAIFVCTAGFDQGSKEWARESLQPGVVRPFAEAFGGAWEWQLAYNDGVAFSSLTGAGPLLLSLLAAAVLLAIAWVGLRTRPDERLRRVAYALLAGGALGNLIDRVRDGAVTDFIRWRAGDHVWPIFNIADVALIVGVALLVIEAGVAYRRRAIMRT